jgi:hypothetical protein
MQKCWILSFTADVGWGVNPLLQSAQPAQKHTDKQQSKGHYPRVSLARFHSSFETYTENIPATGQRTRIVMSFNQRQEPI